MTPKHTLSITTSDGVVHIDLRLAPVVRVKPDGHAYIYAGGEIYVIPEGTEVLRLWLASREGSK